MLNSYAPAALIPALAWISTIFEIVFGVAFLVGFQLEYVAYGSAILFALFAFGMTWGTGIKSPLDASVFADAAGALYSQCFSPQSAPRPNQQPQSLSYS